MRAPRQPQPALGLGMCRSIVDVVRRLLVMCGVERNPGPPQQEVNAASGSLVGGASVPEQKGAACQKFIPGRCPTLCRTCGRPKNVHNTVPMPTVSEAPNVAPTTMPRPNSVLHPASMPQPQPPPVEPPRTLAEIIREVEEMTAKFKGKHVVVFIGSTGCGKTTFMRYLLGHRMYVKTTQTRQVIEAEDENGSGSLVIGHSGSETRSAVGEQAKWADADVVLVDLPGDHDTERIPMVLLRNALIRSKVIQQAASVRIVLMCQVEHLGQDRGGSFEDMLRSITGMFSESDFDKVWKCMSVFVTPVARMSMTLKTLLQDKTNADLLRSLENNAKDALRVAEKRSSLEGKLACRICEAIIKRTGEVGVANPLSATALADTQRVIAKTAAISNPSATFRIAFPADAVRMLQNDMQARKDACDAAVGCGMAALASAARGALDLYREFKQLHYENDSINGIAAQVRRIVTTARDSAYEEVRRSATACKADALRSAMQAAQRMDEALSCLKDYPDLCTCSLQELKEECLRMMEGRFAGVNLEAADPTSIERDVRIYCGMEGVLRDCGCSGSSASRRFLDRLVAFVKSAHKDLAVVGDRPLISTSAAAASLRRLAELCGKLAFLGCENGEATLLQSALEETHRSFLSSLRQAREVVDSEVKSILAGTCGQNRDDIELAAKKFVEVDRVLSNHELCEVLQGADLKFCDFSDLDVSQSDVTQEMDDSTQHKLLLLKYFAAPASKASTPLRLHASKQLNLFARLFKAHCKTLATDFEKKLEGVEAARCAAQPVSSDSSFSSATTSNTSHAPAASPTCVATFDVSDLEKLSSLVFVDELAGQRICAPLLEGALRSLHSTASTMCSVAAGCLVPVPNCNAEELQVNVLFARCVTQCTTKLRNKATIVQKAAEELNSLAKDLTEKIDEFVKGLPEHLTGEDRSKILRENVPAVATTLKMGTTLSSEVAGKIKSVNTLAKVDIAELQKRLAAVSESVSKGQCDCEELTRVMMEEVVPLASSGVAAWATPARKLWGNFTFLISQQIAAAESALQGKDTDEIVAMLTRVKALLCTVSSVAYSGDIFCRMRPRYERKNDAARRDARQAEHRIQRRRKEVRGCPCEWKPTRRAARRLGPSRRVEASQSRENEQDPPTPTPTPGGRAREQTRRRPTADRGDLPRSGSFRGTGRQGGALESAEGDTGEFGLGEAAAAECAFERQLGAAEVQRRVRLLEQYGKRVLGWHRSGGGDCKRMCIAP